MLSRSERSLHTGRLQQQTALCLPDHYELGDARGEHAARPAAPGEKHAVAVGLLRDQVEILVGTSLLYAAQHNANAFTLKIAAGNTNKIFSSHQSSAVGRLWPPVANRCPFAVRRPRRLCTQARHPLTI